MNENCPCDAVKEIRNAVERHELQLSKSETDSALIQQDLGYIKARLDEKKKFNSQTAANIIQTVCSLLIAAAAAKLGLN